MFERDCDETKIWINEKLKAASDEGYLVSSLNFKIKGNKYLAKNVAITVIYLHSFCFTISILGSN